MIYICKVISLLIIFSVVIMSLFTNIRITKTQQTIIYLFFSLALSLMAYFVDVPIGWDLARHLNFIEQIYSSNISLFDYLFNNTSSIGGGYNGLLTFNIIQYFIANYTSNYMIISAIFVFADYAIVSYIAIDWQISTVNRSNIPFLSLLLCFCFLPYVFCVSGLRNALCASLLALGIYLYLYKKKKVIVFIVLAFLAATVHPAAIITIPFVFIAKLDLKALGYIAVFILSALAQSVAKWMSTSSIRYFQIIGSKYFSYTSEEQYRASRAQLYTVLILISIFLLIYFCTLMKNKKDDDNSEKNHIYNFLAVYMVYILGNIGNYDMVLRPAYVLGPLSPVLCSLILDNEIWTNSVIEKRTQKIFRSFAYILCLTFGIYLNYKFFVYYGEAFI